MGVESDARKCKPPHLSSKKLVIGRTTYDSTYLLNFVDRGVGWGDRFGTRGHPSQGLDSGSFTHEKELVPSVLNGRHYNSGRP